MVPTFIGYNEFGSFPTKNEENKNDADLHVHNLKSFPLENHQPFYQHNFLLSSYRHFHLNLKLDLNNSHFNSFFSSTGWFFFRLDHSMLCSFSSLLTHLISSIILALTLSFSYADQSSSNNHNQQWRNYQAFFNEIHLNLFSFSLNDNHSILFLLTFIF